MSTCWCLLLSIIWLESRLLRLSHYIATKEYTRCTKGPWCEDMMSSTKSEVLQCYQRTELWPVETCTNAQTIWWSSAMWFSNCASEQTDRQTYSSHLCRGQWLPYLSWFVQQGVKFAMYECFDVVEKCAGCSVAFTTILKRRVANFFLLIWNILWRCGTK